MTGACPCPRATVTKFHTLSGCPKQIRVVSEFRRPKVQDRVSAGLAPSAGCEGTVPGLAQLPVVCWQSWASLGLYTHRSNLCHYLQMAFSLCRRLCTNFSFPGGHQLYWNWTLANDLILTQLYVQSPCFQVRWHSEVPGVRTSTPRGGQM